MINGDISNESPPRIIVIIDVVAETDFEDQRKLLKKVQVRGPVKINILALSSLWRASSTYGLSVELAAFATDDWTQEHLDKLMDRLERRGGNPFNYAELYDDIDEFIKDIPYRNNLKGIIDVPDRVARYGSYGIELQNL